MLASDSEPANLKEACLNGLTIRCDRAIADRGSAASSRTFLVRSALNQSPFLHLGRDSNCHSSGDNSQNGSEMHGC